MRGRAVQESDSEGMPFLDHLEELRWRLIWALLAIVVGVVVSFVLFVKFDIIGILERPITPYMQGRRLVFTHPGDPLSIVMMASLAMGMVVAVPVILYQTWAFVAPALYRHERRVVLPVLFGAILLFIIGASMAYFIVLPLALKFLMGFQSQSLEPMITAADYFSFAISLTVAMGLSFELPIVILALSLLGVVTPQFLSKFRRHAAVICLVAAAFLSPGDLLMTTVAMAIPLYVLYEFSVALSWIVFRRRAKKAAREAAAEEALV